jgi:hypothetical protein
MISEEWIELLSQVSVPMITSVSHNSLWIAGDFNLPDINWNNMTIEGSTYPNHINKSFIDIVQDLCILKKIAPSGGRRENFLGISCEKS